MTPTANRALPAERPFWIINGIVSSIALAGLAYLLLIRGGSHGAGGELAAMPAINAAWNTLSATLLILAVRAIRRGKPKRHRALVTGAFASSVFFLAGYLAYHFVHGDTRYPATAPGRIPYLLVLASHVLLSIPVVPLCLAAFYYALKGRFTTHKRITRFLYPTWLYVSVTGVVVFAWLKLVT